MALDRLPRHAVADLHDMVSETRASVDSCGVRTYNPDPGRCGQEPFAPTKNRKKATSAETNLAGPCILYLWCDLGKTARGERWMQDLLSSTCSGRVVKALQHFKSDHTVSQALIMTTKFSRAFMSHTTGSHSWLFFGGQPLV